MSDNYKIKWVSYQTEAIFNYFHVESFSVLVGYKKYWYINKGCIRIDDSFDHPSTHFRKLWFTGNDMHTRQINHEVCYRI